MVKKLLSYSLFWISMIPVLAKAQQPAGPPVGDKALTEKASSWLRGDRTGFIENNGQVKDQHGKPNTAVKYLLNLPGLNVQLRAGGFSYDAYYSKSITGKEKAAMPAKFHRVDVDLQGANPDAHIVAGMEVAGSTINVFSELGQFNAIHKYGKVTYENIYPGIDLEFLAQKGTEKPVEYNFIVHPGADASQIKMHYNSGSNIALKEGMITMQLAFGTLKEKIPASYTGQDGRSLAVQYKKLPEAENIYAFNVPAYDQHQTLVIDPTPSLVWSTYFGGAGTTNHYLSSVSEGEGGNIYAIGYTGGITFTATAGAHQSSSGGGQDALAVKFTSAGVLVWATYYGGEFGEFPYAMVFDPAGALYMGGYTNSTTGIALNGAQNSIAYTGANPSSDIFLAKFNTAGVLQWGTYYGGSGSEYTYGLAVDKNSAVYISGVAGSAGLAYAASGMTAHQTAINGTGSTSSSDAFLIKFSSTGVKKWATYYGGADADQNARCFVDDSANVYLAGLATSSTNIAYNHSEGQTKYTAGITANGFIAKFDSTGVRKWGRYVPTSAVSCVGIDPRHHAFYMTGRTPGNSVGVGMDAFTSSDAFQTAPAGGSFDQHLDKFGEDGKWKWGTYIGGEVISTQELYSGVTADTAGNAYVVFATGSTNSRFATDCSYQPVAGGGGTSKQDLVIMKFAPDGTRLWGTFWGNALGQVMAGDGSPIAVGSNGSIYVVGNADQGTPMTAGAFQPTGNGTGTTNNAIILKFNEGYLPSDFKVAASTVTPASQDACALGVPLTIVGNSVVATNPNNFTTGIFYQWQQSASATGPWGDLVGEKFKDLTPPTGSSSYYYRRIVKANNGYCDLAVVDSSSTSFVNITGNIAPTAKADGPKWYVCPGGTVALNGSASTAVSPATISNYTWYVGSATTGTAGAAYTTPANNAATTYTLKVTDSRGCVTVDQTTIMPVTANAGPDVSYCSGSSGIEIGADPVTGITYNWTAVSGTATATALSCTACAQPIAKPTAVSVYRVTATIPLKGGGTCTNFDDVTVTPVAAPAATAPNGFGGPDYTICKNTTALLGVTNAAYTYTWTPGTFLDNTTLNKPTFNAGTTVSPCPMTYTVTAVLNGCTFEDQVKVSVINPDINYGGQTFCGPGWVSGGNSNCTNAIYTWNIVSGPGQVVSLRNGNADAYLKNTGPNGGAAAVFNRTTTLNGVTCTSGNVSVTSCAGTSGCNLVSITQLSKQGCPKTFPGQPLQLTVNGISTADYNISWSPANLVDNPTASVVNIASATQATITVTVTNKFDGSVCSASLPVNAPSWALPVVSLTDKNTCPNTAKAIGVAPVTGYTYAWTPVSTLNSATISNPTATLAASENYTLTVRETATGCQVTKSMNVIVASLIFDAGPDRAVCNNGVVTLGPIVPAGRPYTYSWTPANGAWRNGTNQFSANPQVLFAGAAQTYGVTVTDTLSGCTLTDNVTLGGATGAGAYSGVAAPPSICPGGISQIGNALLPNASYLWTPVTGLSCTTCSSPVASPAATTTYTVAVSYPGCSTPVTEPITITVKPTTAFDFINKTVCPSTPVNIGVGGTGNPASIANAVSYSWSPATGLSCTTCASPNANPQIATTYTCTITFASGCTLSDNVTITPTFSASAKPDAAICASGTVILGLPSVANVTYAWTPATGLSSAAVAQPTFTAGTVAATTTYTLTATGINGNAGCTFKDAVQVTTNAPAAFTINGNAVVCAGGNATTLSASATLPNTLYQWTPTTGIASPNSTTTVVTPTATQVYKLVQTDLASGCSNYQQIQVVVMPNTIAATSGTVNTCINNGVALPLTVTSTGSYSYSWAGTALLSNPYIQNPVSYASASTSYIATITDNANNCTLPVPANIVVGVCQVSLSGNVFRDGNGLKDGTVNSSGTMTTSIPAGIYVSLVDASNKIIGTMPVNADGTYVFPSVNAGTYSVMLTNSLTGSNTPVSPAGWINTGANLGMNPGSTGTNGQLPNIIVGTTDVTNANLAIQQPPVSQPKAYVIDQPAPGQSITLNGSLPAGGTGTASPGEFTGADPEDGALDGTSANKTVVITSVPDNGQLWYNGSLVTAGQKIANYDPALMVIKMIGTGYTGLSFLYAYEDASGASSEPVSYSITWATPLPVNLISFEASEINATAQLTWETANEQNSNYFIVERSIDAKVWHEAGRIKAAGNSQGSRRYSLVDNKPAAGINYYRLRSVDMGGSYKISEIRQLNFDDTRSLTISVAPNPAGQQTLVLFSTPLENSTALSLWNNAGQLIRSVMLPAGTQQYELKLKSEASGIYYIHFEGKNLNRQLKFMKQ